MTIGHVALTPYILSPQTREICWPHPHHRNSSSSCKFRWFPSVLRTHKPQKHTKVTQAAHTPSGLVDHVVLLPTSALNIKDELLVKQICCSHRRQWKSVWCCAPLEPQIQHLTVSPNFMFPAQNVVSVGSLPQTMVLIRGNKTDLGWPCRTCSVCFCPDSIERYQ